MPATISSFFGEYRFLSNFYPQNVILDGQVYPTVEHAYQAAKTLSEYWRICIRNAGTPGQAKRMGRKVPMRPDWDAVKLQIMEKLLRQKFSEPYLKKLLTETQPLKLIESNNWGDVFWGCCKGLGENHLGKILM